MAGMNEVILIVDDEPKIVKQARDYLERSGFRVLAAGDGKTALAQARHERPDLIVLDLNLPEMDGLEATTRIREMEQGKAHVPIIAITAHAMKGDREQFLASGMDSYVSKPIRPEVLFDTIEELLAQINGTSNGTSNGTVNGAISGSAAKVFPPSQPEQEQNE